MDENYIGFLKYTGESVRDGVLDARKSAEALLGFDEIVRYFLIEEDVSLKTIDFQIPVKVRKGSWEIVIPELVDKLFTPSGAVYSIGLAYGVAVAKKAADDGLFETGTAKDIKKLFKSALIASQWTIRIAKHLGKFSKETLNARISKDRSDYIEVINSKKEVLIVEKKYLESYTKCPQKIFSKNASIIDDDKKLELGVFVDGKPDITIISNSEKGIFYSTNDQETILFPELKHGQFVELEGEITRINENTNTAGFKYQEHILTSIPEKGNIAFYKNSVVAREKDHIFPKVKIYGIIHREDIQGEFKENRPRIIFSKIEQSPNRQKKMLFSGVD